MKNSMLFLLIILAFNSPCFSQDTTNLEASIEIIPIKIDFGSRAYGSEVTDSFQVINHGHTPLIITKCKASCGCTVANCPEKPVLPGEITYIPVSYDSKRQGRFTKSLKIYSNASDVPTVLMITGIIETAEAVDSTKNPVSDQD